MALRETNFKPTALRELHSLPHAMFGQLVEKLEWLAQNPIPDGRLKKKLKGWPDIYRLRVGDYRLFYTFGTDWVRVLAVRPRKDAYEGQLQWSEPRALPTGPDLDPDQLEDEELAAGVRRDPWDWSTGKAPTPEALPRSISSDWLAQLRIPAAYHPLLTTCASADDLLAAAVPMEYAERVLDNLYPRPVDEILNQPNYVIQDPEDLTRYREGDLMAFLLKLDPDQERMVDAHLRGPALIRGGPGTGKSTVALYRVKALIDRAEELGRAPLEVLFTTYTPALTRFSADLLEQLLGEQISQARIETADELAREIASLAGPLPTVASQTQQADALRSVLTAAGRSGLAPIGHLRPEYLLDEFNWVIEGQGLVDLQAYLDAERPGRGIALGGTARQVVWQLWSAFTQELADHGLMTPGQIRLRALDLVRQGTLVKRYDAVLIDEAQDLPPVVLALLCELAKDQTGLYLTADSSQAIYFRGFSWRNVHDRLAFRGRSVVLRRNYRTTRAIADAAADFLRKGGETSADIPTSSAVEEGPRPLVAAWASEAEQWRLAADFIRQTSRHLRLKTSSAALLVPTAAEAEAAAAALEMHGLKARFMRGHQLDLKADEVKVMTMRAAKGLEFPIVVVAGLADAAFPGLRPDLDPDEVEAELAAGRRTLYVAMTRAMRGLCLLPSAADPSRLILDLDPDLWERIG